MTLLRVPVPVQPPLTRADLCGQLEPLKGRRVFVSNESGQHGPLRASSGLYRAAGHSWVDVMPEVDWWAHRLAGGPLKAVPWPAGAVWVE
jgi:hypothetical protein